jgi:hypothetical protein
MMTYLIRFDAPVKIEDEWNKIENVVAEIVADQMGHETIIGYVYKDKNGKLRREYCGWLV